MYRSRATAVVVGTALASLACSACSSDSDASIQIVVLEVDVPAELGAWQLTHAGADACLFHDPEALQFTATSGGENVLYPAGEFDDHPQAFVLGSQFGDIVDGRCRSDLTFNVATADPVEVSAEYEGRSVGRLSITTITLKENGSTGLDNSGRSAGSPWLLNP